MKKLLLILLALLSSVCSYAQLTMRIDSVDVSRNTSMDIEPTVILEIRDKYPRIQIVSTIINDTDKNVYIYRRYERRPKSHIKFQTQGRSYLKNTIFILTNDYNEILLHPKDSAVVRFWTFIPEKERVAPTEKTDWEQVFDRWFGLTPAEWSWGKENPSDLDYLEWAQKILPDLKVIIDYNEEPTICSDLISEPINLDKVVFTTNLTAEKSN